MSSRLGIRRRYAGITAIVILAGALVFLFCSKSNPVLSLNEAGPTWALTLDVQDGYSGNKITGARVQYMNDSLKDTSALTNSQGRLKIEGLAAGTQSFKVSNSDTTVKYTDVVVNAASVTDSSGKLMDVSLIVKLFPLTGSISGRIVTQINPLEAKVSARGVVVSLVYANADLENASPKAFQVNTDSSGAFTLTGLPVATGCKLTIAAATVNAIDFKPDSFASPVLVSGITVPLGTIFMRPMNASSFRQMTQAPLVISPNQSISITYSDALDSVSYATLEGIGGVQSVNVISSIKGNTITITPSISLVDSSKYYLTVYAFGKSGGDTTSKTTLLVAGGGLIDVVSSNVLDGNKQAVDGLGLSDSMVFTFNAAITSASATVTQASSPILVSTSFKGSTLVVKPQGNWQPTTYLVKISANLADSTTSTFSFSIATVGGLAFMSSNIYNPQTSSAINGLGFRDTITVTANKTLVSAVATMSQGSTPVPMSVTTTGSVVKVAPYDNLKPATAYTFSITITTAQGETKSFTATFITASSDFYPLTDNIRFDNDPNQPVLNFAPNGTIFITMSSAVKSATAQINGGTPAVNVVISGDTIEITPVTNLSEGVAYNLKLSATNNAGTVYNENNGNYVNGFYVKNPFGPVTSNVRFNNNYAQPVLDFAPNGVIVIIMSDVVQSATALLTNSATTVQSDVRISGDTIRVVPQDLLSLTGTYTLTLTAKGATGLTYQASPFVQGMTVQNKVRVLASNVLSADGLGLSNIPVTSTMFYLLSSTPDPTTLTVTVSPATNTVVSVSGDTVKVKPVNNLLAGTQYGVTITGKTTQGNIINIDLTGTNPQKVFTTMIAAYVVATNMRDANNNPVTNLLPTTELWVKFSRSLAAATNQQLGGGAGTTITYLYGGASNNATVRVSNDTLFAKFVPNALPAYGATVSLKAVTILFADATTIGATGLNLTASILSKASPSVLATNGIVSNVPVDTFGVTGEAWILSSLDFLSVNAVKDGPDIGVIAGMTTAGAGNLVLSNVRTHGDTIFFRPSTRLAYNTEYQTAFEVTLADSSKYTGNDLKLTWKTQKPLYMVSANDMNAGFTAYRPFGCAGDSLVLAFSKPIDLTKTYSIVGLVSRMIYSWSSDARTLTVKPVDTLLAETYSANVDYTTAGVNYAAITVTLTAADGEPWVAKATNAVSVFNSARPALAVRTMPGIEVLNTNLVVSSVNKSLSYVNTDNTKLSSLGAGQISENDSVNVGDTLKVFFSRAVDSAMVASNPAMIVLKTTGGGIPQNVSISYSTDHKTVFVKPSVALSAGTGYTLALTSVQALGMAHSGDANAVVSSTLTCKTKPALIKVVKDVAIALTADTATAANVAGKRQAYSGSISNAYAGGIDAGDVPAQNKVNLVWYEADFRSLATASDTVSSYQLSVKGVDGNWYDLLNLVSANHFNPFAPLTDSIRRYTLDLSGAVQDIHNVDVGPALRIPPKSGNYGNGASIFNYGATLQVRIRTVLDANTNAQLDAGDQVGTWSSPVTFQDNVAPCDTNFVVSGATVLPGNINIPANGGVSVAVTAIAMNLTGQPDGKYTFDFVFPEDMDTSAANAPTIQIFYSQAATPPAPIGVIAAQSYWSNGYTYHMTVRIPGNFDWTAAWIPYYALSIAGVKDASEVPIQYQTWSTVGSAAYSLQTPTPLIPGSMASVQGTTNILDLKAF